MAARCWSCATRTCTPRCTTRPACSARVARRRRLRWVGAWRWRRAVASAARATPRAADASCPAPRRRWRARSCAAASRAWTGCSRRSLTRPAEATARAALGNVVPERLPAITPLLPGDAERVATLHTAAPRAPAAGVLRGAPRQGRDVARRGVEDHVLDARRRHAQARRLARLPARGTALISAGHCKDAW